MSTGKPQTFHGKALGFAVLPGQEGPVDDRTDDDLLSGYSALRSHLRLCTQARLFYHLSTNLSVEWARRGPIGQDKQTALETTT